MDVIDSTTVRYLTAFLARRDLHPLRRWLTVTCPACRKEPAAHDMDHIIVRGYVAVDCNGYRVISPAALGSDETWQDWTAVRPNVTLGEWWPAGEPANPAAVRAEAVITVELYTLAGAPRYDIARDLLAHFDRQEFEVQYDPVGDPNGYQTIEINAQATRQESF